MPSNSDGDAESDSRETVGSNHSVPCPTPKNVGTDKFNRFYPWFVSWDVEDVVDRFVSRQGIRLGHQQQGCQHAWMVARLCSFQNNPANVKFPFMARTYDKN